MPANISEKLIGFGFAKQAAIATPNTLAGIWRLNNLNTNFAIPKLNTENDAEELGKGHEFATQVFKTSWDLVFKIEKYLSSDWAAWVMAFGLGKVVKSGESPNFVYTCTPLNPVTDGIELHAFSHIEQIRPGSDVVLDQMAVGCAVEGFTLSVASGPGRANAKLTADVVGSGKYVEPSGILLPQAVKEKLLPSASLLCTINGVNYVSNKNIISLEAAWKNNLRLDSGYFPGSGFQGAVAQIDTITLTGTSGTANVTQAGGLTKTAEFEDDLATTAENFVNDYAADYLAEGIVLTSDGADLIFTASVAGTPFAHPVITNTAPNLAGTVANTQANVVAAESGAVRGRMEVGDREAGLQFIARFERGSTELAKVKALTEGTAVIQLSYDGNNNLALTYHRLTFSVAELGETDGLVSVAVTTQPLWHPNNGLLTAVAKCNTDGIAQAEAA